MFDLQQFLIKLDEAYSGDPKNIEPLLQEGLIQARGAGDKASILVLLNELMGYYRVMSDAAGIERCAKEALELCDQLGIHDTENHATVLLNIATAYRAIGKFTEAEAYYKRVFAIYQKTLTDPDYRIASLHNNISLLYQETGRLREAKEELQLAMHTISRLPGQQVEVAITHTNLGNTCFQLGETEEGMSHMHAAIALFEGQPGKKDAHYASALSGLGQGYYLLQDYAAARDAFLASAKELKENYGENESYHVVKNNAQMMDDLVKRQEAAKANTMKGLELSKAYFETYGKPMLLEKYPDYAERIAAGLCGEGSECLGFDDAISTDHDFGPGFCLWLTAEDYAAIGEQLQKDYESLPQEFNGMPARNTTETGQGRVGVMTIDDFFRRYTGFASAPDMKKEEPYWLMLEPESLRTVTNGEVFYDPSGVFTERQNAFRFYPRTVRLKRLAAALASMAQAGQYNFARMKKRKDTGAAFLAFSAFIDQTIAAAFLLNHQYMPFYKWKMRAMDDFICLKELKGRLEALITAGPAAETAQQQIEEICAMFVNELHRQGITKNNETFLEAQKNEILAKLQRA